ncbi:MAG: hypothetical protein AB1458_07785 [Bacteroidota bacterium]
MTSKNRVLFTLAVAGSLLYMGCGGGATDGNGGEVPKGMMALDLSQYGKNIIIHVPDSTAGPLSVEDMGGGLRITVGKNFQIDLKEGAGDLNTKKDVDIKQNEVYALDTMVVDQPDGIVYCWHMKGAAPADSTKSIYEYRFFAVVKAGDVTYEVEDVAGEIFGRKAVMSMFEAARSIKPKEAKKPEA